MSIYQGSRYYDKFVDFVAFEDGGDKLPIVFYSFSSIGTFSWQEHVYVEGERMDTISNQYYKTPDLWWIIPEYNPQVEDFLNIPGGTIIRIPVV